MLMIVTLHTLGQGGILFACEPGSAAYKAAWAMEILCYGGVNIFGMISGYVGVRSRFKAGRGLELWLQVAAYTIGLTALTALLIPESVTGADWKCALLPVTTGQYWYVSSYFVVFFFAPFLNKMLLALDRRGLLLLGAASFVITTVWAPMGMDLVLPMLSGYSAVWLCFLYIFGGVLRLLEAENSFKKWQLLGAYLLCAALTWGWKMLTEGALSGVLPAKLSDMLVPYTSPTTTLAAAALVLLFAKLRTGEGFGARAIEFLSPLAFGVYLIHTQRYVWGMFMYERFASLRGLPWPLMCLAVAGAAAGLYLACTLADALRRAVFRLIGVEKLCGAFQRAVERPFEKLGAK